MRRRRLEFIYLLLTSQGEFIDEKDRCATCEGDKTLEEEKNLDVYIDKGEVLYFLLLIHKEWNMDKNLLSAERLTNFQELFLVILLFLSYCR